MEVRSIPDYFVALNRWTNQTQRMKIPSDYCIVPLCWVTFCIHPGIIPVGPFSRKCAKSINQSSVDFHRLMAWLTVSQLWLDWFIGFVPPDLFLRGRGSSDWTERDNTVTFSYGILLEVLAFSASETTASPLILTSAFSARCKSPHATRFTSAVRSSVPNAVNSRIWK